MTWTSV